MKSMMGVLFLLTLVGSPVMASLGVDRVGERVVVKGDHFSLTVDLAMGGEVTEVQLFDGAKWNTLFRGPKLTYPMVRLAEKDKLISLANDPKAKLLVLESSPEKVSLKVQGVPASPDRAPSGWKVTLGYEIYPEGAVFTDILYELSDGSYTLTAASLGFAVEDTILKAAKFCDRYDSGTTNGFRTARVAFGVNPRCSYTNEVEVMVERRTPMVGKTTFTAKDGRYVWTLGQGEETLKPGYRYENRIGMGLGTGRSGKPQSNAMGHRVYHWVNWIDTRNWYPSNEQIDTMVRLDATMLILHHEWMLQRGSNGHPHADYSVVRNREQMTRCIDHAHSKGMKVGLYMRGVEWYGVNTGYFSKYCKKNWDGIYVDWHGPIAVSYHDGRYKPEAKFGDVHLSTDGTYVPGKEYFLFAKRLRETVGPGGFLIGHYGGWNSGTLSNLVFDAYLPGEAGSDHDMFKDRDKAIYKGMMGGCVCMPWTLDSPIFLEPEGVAKMAVWGFYPHIVTGLEPPRSKRLFPIEPDAPLYANVLPYWRILSKVDVEKATAYNLPCRNNIVVESSNPDVQAIVYKADDTYLIIVANLGKGATSAELQLDARALGMEGSYQASRIDASTGRERPCEATPSKLKTGALAQWGLEGYKFVKK